MKQFAAVFAAACVSLSMACGGNVVSNTATSPSLAAAVSSTPLDSSLISFSGLTADAAPVSSYTESGYRVTMPSGDWKARTTYGNPAPFVQFWAEAGSTVTGQLEVATPSPTYFKSVDLYASTTPIPYVITGRRNSAIVFSLSGTVSNTFGAFRTISNPNGVLIDALSITLTNTAAACCRNPMGLDDIAFSDTPQAPPAVYSLSGTVTDSTSGAPLAGAKVSVTAGPDRGVSATTDASGAYVMNGLSEGGITVTAAATNYLQAAQSTFMDANRTLAFRLQRDPRTIQYPAPPAGATTIGFGGLTSNGASVSSYSESGFSVLATAADWVASTAYGHPAPFIQFFAEPATSATGRVDITAGGAAFTFVSAEFYSSTTRIPYTITGTRNGAMVFTLNDELPNTLGNFRPVVNPNTSTPVDRVSIVLTNTASVKNPMGLDTIVVVR